MFQPEESTETALEVVYKTDVDAAGAAIQMEAPGADYAEAAVKSTHYAESYENVLSELTIDAHIIIMCTSSCFENTNYCVL